MVLDDVRGIIGIITRCRYAWGSMKADYGIIIRK